MLPVEERIRSAARVVVWACIGFAVFWAVFSAALHSSKGPVMVPCPPQECVLHPHAPHGPGG